jgi:hypothetical protein
MAANIHPRGGQTMEWTPITRGDFDPVGVNKPGSDYVDFTAELGDEPPAAWARAFTNPSGVEMSGGRTAPRLSGSTIYLTCPPNELAGRVKEVDARIAYANDFYEKRVLPDLQREEAIQEEQRLADKALMDEARNRAKNL